MFGFVEKMQSNKGNKWSDDRTVNMMPWPYSFCIKIYSLWMQLAHFPLLFLNIIDCLPDTLLQIACCFEPENVEIDEQPRYCHAHSGDSHYQNKEKDRDQQSKNG